ncbi:uncharacterized protein At1g01500 [Neltuma alba]|uniref:uncharacterized protein At1g01500 n=1 Tax=Neltuma alba TaxID=207710 RepID=UPI0010A39122|nr:uncharacterized protein At1g01500-like [Prosopis alba]XP_028757733.1 uncharacterized protein At1g01500-like [Prosopis alba]XP_028757734.1 uncharacterized protein At1g01500-like [Prosopis alba]
MEVPYDASSNGGANDRIQIIKYSPYRPRANLSSAWFDLRVFYVRISNFRVDRSTPEFLTLNHIPLNPDTLIMLNGVRCSMYSDGLSSVLRRDRVDKKSKETTYVTTDCIRLTGSMKFEVYDKEERILWGILEMSNSNGFTGESNFNAKQWSMICETEITANTGFLKGKNVTSPEITSPTIEVYVAGCFSGTPIILTKTLQLNFPKKQDRRCSLDAIPEYETTDCQRDVSDRVDMQVADFRSFKRENEGDYNCMYWQGTGHIDGEDSELSWFNAGVRVGVGIGLGICLGVGVGFGLLARSYKATARIIHRRLL